MSERELHTKAYGQWRNEAADEYIQAQRRAFLDGFETAAKEAREWNLLRDWLEEQRDEAKQQHDETGDVHDFARYHAYVEVLVKLSEMGCRPDENDHE